jgi:membrane-bound lytic murein transglycosylase D
MSLTVRLSRTLAVTALISCSLLQAETLPRPAGLEPDVAFWKRIFSEVTARQALVHDNRYLNIIYEKMDLPSNADWDEERRIADAVRGKYERILRSLASGKREDLTADEARVLALWPANVSNQELSEAAGRVRFQQGVANRFREGLVRSGQWREHIRSSLIREGVPEELVALPHVESSFDPSARSSVGASGLWQFTRETGRRFLRIDNVVDERRDPFESSEAAARLLKYNYSVLGSWPLAITAYNHGVSGMRRAVQSMGTNDLETILRRYDGPAFGFASRNFYLSFLAAHDLDEEPERYFGDVSLKAPLEPLIIQLPDYYRAQSLERALGVSKDDLQFLNPALLLPVWQGSKYIPRGFRLRVPVIDSDKPAEKLLAAIPHGQRYDSQRADRTHRVRRGESIASIARRFEVPPARLLSANGMSGKSKVRAGQVLFIPERDEVEQSAQPVAVAAASASPPPPAKAAVADPPTVAPARPAAPKAEKVPGEKGGASLADPTDYLVAKDGSIEIQAAETLSQVADWVGMSSDQLRELNRLPRKRSLQLGQRLRLSFEKVSQEAFSERRIAYHRELQEDFFSRYRIVDTAEHRLRSGESIWVLALQKYKVPVWLLRQYNPDIDLNQVRPGTRLVFPRLEPFSGSRADHGSLVQAG